MANIMAMLLLKVIWTLWNN